jgi:predicted HD superfamily hydrolase involved in NAD metabolism
MTDQRDVFMSSTLENEARRWAESSLSPHRYQHSAGVATTAFNLAVHHHLPEADKLRIAGWIHDIAKEWPAPRLLATAQEWQIPVSEIEAQAPYLLHGAIAVEMAHRQLGIHDPVITSAVLYHTTGHPAMSRADKVFYLADLIEPLRSFSWVVQARNLAYENIDRAMLFALTHQMRRLLKRGALLDPKALEVRNRLLLDGVELTERSKS